MAVSPSPGLPSDFGGVTHQPFPGPTSQALGSPFAGLEGADPMHVSPSSAGTFGASLGGHLPLGLDTGIFGTQSYGTSMSGGLGGPTVPQATMYGQPPVAAANIMGQGIRPTHGFYQAAGQTVPVNIPGTVGARPVGVAAPGSPILGMSGSPVRIMTRGGKSPAVSLSSSPSGPGLEDAVRALGLTMSPSKGGPAKTGTKPGSRPLSPGQSLMGGLGMSSSQGSGDSVSGDMAGLGGLGTLEQETVGSGPGIFSDFETVVDIANMCIYL